MMLKSTSRLLTMVVAASLSGYASFAQHGEAPNEFGQGLLGRWDLNVTINGTVRPSWIEVHKSGSNRMVGYYLGTGGSARPVSKVSFADGKFTFSVPPQWEPNGNDIVVSGQVVSADSISGTIQEANGSINSFGGRRAPRLIRDKAPVWGAPIKLIGKDLTGWTAFGSENQWKVVNGVLTSEKAGANIKTNQKFNDFKLHVEFRVPDASNSGVYLRGRYEVQVVGKSWNEPPRNGFGGIYGFVEPIEDAAIKSADAWQTYDITLVGRLVTIVVNGKLVASNAIIPGITGGAMDSNEGEPGPIYLQGDHGPIEYRNIIITPAK